MKVHYECLSCMANQCQRIVERGTEDFALRKRGIIAAARLIGQMNESSVPAIIGSRVFLGVYDIIRNDDPFRDYKGLSNRLAGEVVSDLEERDVDLKTALKLAIVGNVVDFAVDYSPEQLEEDVRRMLKEKLYRDDSEELFDELSKAKRLLYLTDNCGEIHFDRLFLKKVKGVYPDLEIYVAGKEGPIINDATVDDLRRVGFEEIGRIVSTGTRIVGVPLGEVSEGFLYVFRRVDLIIAKGQGNFETLSEVSDPRMFYLLKAKCMPIARELGVPQGALLCIRSR